ncbi:hypothetical protein V8B97DRAFT_1987571 [Scleroderma yunnanense]
MHHYVPMDQRGSLDDLCEIYISRYRGNQAPFSNETGGLVSQFQSLPLPAGCLFPRTEPVEPRPPLPEPGCGCSVDGDILPKPSRSGQYFRIPRPRNAFILFRCDFVHQRKVNPKEAENDHVSRKAGQLWNRMTREEKQPWIKMAEKERQRHAILYPNYKYMPNPTNFKMRKTKIKGNRPLPHKTLNTSVFDFILPFDAQSYERRIYCDGSDTTNSHDPATCQLLHRQPNPKRRPSSCPPIGATPAPDLDLLQSWLPPLVSKDDLRRRPSQATMYKTVTYPSVQQPMPNHHIPLPHRDDAWFGMPEPYLWELVDSADYDTSYSCLPLTSTTGIDSTMWQQAGTAMQNNNLCGKDLPSLKPTFVDPFQFPFACSETVDGFFSSVSDTPPPQVGLPRPRRNAVVEHAP